MKYASWAYGVVFDIYNTTDTTVCEYGIDPDVAGIGVVLSFAIAAFITAVASIAAALLDASTMDDRAFLPGFFRRWLHRGLSPDAIERRLLWRRVLDRLILSFADQQLITGFALLICGYIGTFQFEYSANSAHWNIVVYMSCLSSSTHLACVLTLRKYFDGHKVTAVLRVVFVIAFSLFLIPSIIMSDCFEVFLIPTLLLYGHEVEKGRPAKFLLAIWYAFQAAVYTYLFWAAIMQLLVKQQKQIKAWRLFWWVRWMENWRWVGKHLARLVWYLVFLNPGTIFILQLLFATTSLAFTLAQKFARPTATDFYYCPPETCTLCSLNTTGENKLGFGQLLALIFLTLPLLAALETWIEERQKMPQYSKMAPNGGGHYAPVGSDASFLPMAPMKQTNNSGSYFPFSGASSFNQRQPSYHSEGSLLSPSILSQGSPSPRIHGNLSSPPTAFYSSYSAHPPEQSRLYGSPEIR